MPLPHTARCKDCSAIEFLRNHADALDALCVKVNNDGAKVARAVVRLRLDGSYSLSIAYLLSSKRTRAVRVPKFHATRLSGCKARLLTCRPRAPRSRRKARPRSDASRRVPSLPRYAGDFKDFGLSKER
jgi:hypothetical protein